MEDDANAPRGGFRFPKLALLVGVLVASGAGLLALNSLGASIPNFCPYGTYCPPAVDNTPPTLHVQNAPVSAPATSSGGAPVSFVVTAQDPDDAASSPQCAPASGAQFPIGVTTVGCTSHDTHGNVGSTSFSVTVRPVANADAYGLTTKDTLTVTGLGVLANDFSAANPVVSITATTQHGTLSANTDGSFSYTPTKNFVGTDSFSYNLASAGLTSNAIAVQLTVSAPGSLCDLSQYPTLNGSLNLQNANLNGCDLTGASLVGANLKNASLKAADLTNADLTNADLSNANLKDSIFAGTKVTGVVWSGATCPDGSSVNGKQQTCVGHL